MGVLIASPVRQTAEVLRVVLPSWKEQYDSYGERVPTNFVLIDDIPEEDKEAKDVLYSMFDPAISSIHRSSLAIDTTSADHIPMAADETTHYWDRGAFRRITLLRNFLFAGIRQRLLDDPDIIEVLLVDSDVLLSPLTTINLSAAFDIVDGDWSIVSPIYWTKFTPEAREMPNVWDYHPYDFAGPKRIQELREAHTPISVGGLGAVTMMTRRMAERIWQEFPAPFSPIESLRKVLGDWEDKHFCVKMNVAFGDCLYAVQLPPGADVLHLYRPSDLERVAQWQKEQEQAVPVLLQRD